ncbi:MAG: hypothetical protein F2820_06725 [Actinobacteria bacterium]|nr:hypothetical protein [Actinomycetota bacterium]
MSASSRPVTQPHHDRLPPDHPHYDEIILCHGAAVERGEAGYLDPTTGLFVMTASAHLARGKCCANNCRHCPYVV